MTRNIANVVHDLAPLVKYLKQKAIGLEKARSASELAGLISKIQADSIMLERYLEALKLDIAKDGIIKTDV